MYLNMYMQLPSAMFQAVGPSMQTRSPRARSIEIKAHTNPPHTNRPLTAVSASTRRMVEFEQVGKKLSKPSRPFSC